MTTTITKRADELKPGDILPCKIDERRLVVLGRMDSDGVDVRYSLGVIGEDRTVRRWYPVGETVEVESPTLTPAQQHAEELLRDVKVFLACDKNKETPPRSFIERAEMLVAQIDPPQPPTLEEAMTFVNQLYLMGREGDPIVLGRAGKLLDRARRSGILK